MAVSLETTNKGSVEFMKIKNYFITVIYLNIGEVDMVVLGAGTGGTLTGLARKIKQKCPKCKVSIFVLNILYFVLKVSWNLKSY
jgi:1-aminocyclopropane-1-carboxylate deaminase/D-cysteine desulfhydrase-like pyridoxal-dependent ACC family enzyme